MCLGEALQLWHQRLGVEASDPHNDNEFGGADGNGEDGRDLDLNEDGNDVDKIPPSPVDGPPIFNEVTLALTRGFVHTRLLETFTKTLNQLQSTPSPHSKHLGSTSDK